MAAGRKTGGRQKGTPNKVTASIREAVLEAAATAHPEGMAGYLRHQAIESPAAFMSLLGKLLPSQVDVAGDVRIEAVAVNFVRPGGQD